MAVKEGAEEYRKKLTVQATTDRQIRFQSQSQLSHETFSTDSAVGHQQSSLRRVVNLPRARCVWCVFVSFILERQGARGLSPL